MKIVVTCGKGLEPLLAQELAALGAQEIQQDVGAVSAQGDWPLVWRANYTLRTANRVLVAIGGWAAASEVKLFQGAFRTVMRWRGPLFSPRATISVRASCSASRISDPQFAALKVKDAIVDAQRKLHGERSSVDRQAADLPLRLRIHRNRASLLVDTSGESLDRRGYRLDRSHAPLRETLAAACVLAAEWDGQGPVVDRMCGSGTLLAEAGAIALGLPAGRLRRGRDGMGWAFERQPDFNPRLCGEVCSAPLPVLSRDVKLYGSDQHREVLDKARANLVRAQLDEHARIRQGDAFDLPAPAGPGLLLMNPPYGDRLHEWVNQWTQLGVLLRERYAGWTAVLLARSQEQEEALGIEPVRWLNIFNGPLKARILVLKPGQA